jgi:hypothetical protein
VADEEGRPIVAPLVKATFDILPGGALDLAEEQIAIDFAGAHHGEPGQSSLRFEPEVAFVKPATDVVLIGHAHAPARHAVAVDVALQVGPLARALRVSGDRVWAKRFFGSAPTDPAPFEKIPLVYERAYGGWDLSAEDPRRHGFHPGNPVGVGYRGKGARFEEGAPLPNIEDPAAMLTSYQGRSWPAGFGFTCPHWEPRSLLAGTYDDAWMRSRMPLLPRDFDRRFFNAASPGLVAPGCLRGDEPVLVYGAAPEGQLSFRLPGVAAPVCRIAFRHREDESLVTNLDTVILDLDARKLLLLWRAFTTLRDGPLDVRAIEIRVENAPRRRAEAPLPDNVVRLPGRRAA